MCIVRDGSLEGSTHAAHRRRRAAGPKGLRAPGARWARRVGRTGPGEQRGSCKQPKLRPPIGACQVKEYCRGTSNANPPEKSKKAITVTYRGCLTHEAQQSVIAAQLAESIRNPRNRTPKSQLEKSGTARRQWETSPYREFRQCERCPALTASPCGRQGRDNGAADQDGDVGSVPREPVRRLDEARGAKATEEEARLLASDDLHRWTEASARHINTHWPAHAA